MKRLTRNFISILLSDIGRRLIGFAAVAYLTRTISVGEYGAVNVGLTLLSYGLMLSSGGLSSYGTREIVRSDSPGLVGGILGTRLLNSLIVYGLTAVIAVVAIANRLTSGLTLLFCGSLFLNAFLLEWYFQGKEAMGVIGLSRLAGAAVYLGMLLLFVRDHEHVLWIAGAALAGDLTLSVVLMAVYGARNGTAGLRPRFDGWMPIMKQAFPIGAGSILAHLSVNLPPLVLGALLSNTEVGIYSAASKLVFFLLILDRVMATILLPASTRFFASSPEQLSATLGTAVRWILVLALPLSVGGMLLADRLLPFVFGAQYGAAAPAFRVLIWFFFFTLLHTIYSTALIVINREKLFGKLMAVSSAVYLVAIVAGSWFLGPVGAAGGMVFSEAVTVLLMRRASFRLIPIRFPRNAAGLLLAVAGMSGVIVLLPGLPLFVLIGAGGAVYVLLIGLLRVVTRNDLREILSRV
ncbi:MAG TPA: flippase [Bacteroidota bacterium]|nr:flippase [Bacteroidota bacterium]